MHFVAVNIFTESWGWIVHVFHGFDAVKMVQSWMGTDWGYAVLFGLLLSCGLGVPLPEDVPLMVAGYFVANGQMNLFIAAFCAWFGIIGGDCVLYSLGRKFGLGITRLPVIGSHISKERIDRAHALFEKYGVWVVAIGRLFAGIRGAMVVTAGTIRFTFSHFLIADGLAAIFSGGLFMAIGFWCRKHFGDLEQIREKTGKYERPIMLAIVAAVVLFGLWKWLQEKRRKQRIHRLQQLAKHREAASGQS